jgi:hypothetical protein
MLTAVRPISASGWRTVVSGGVTIVENSRSSKPTTDTSSGTRSPRERAAWTGRELARPRGADRLAAGQGRRVDEPELVGSAERLLGERRPEHDELRGQPPAALVAARLRGQVGLSVAMVQAQGIDTHSPAVLRVAQKCLPASHGALTAAKVGEALNNAGH